MSTYISFLAARRRALGLDSEQLALHCHMTPDMIERMEQGTFVPSPSQAYSMGLALGIDAVEVGTWAVTQLLFHPEFLVEHVTEASA